MSVITNVKKTGSTVAGLLKAPAFDSTEARKPLFAAVGVAELALAQVKEVPADVTAEAKRVQARLTEASKSFPAQAAGLRGTVESRLSGASTKANDTYARLAVRGEKLVGQVRRQRSTEAAIAEGRAAVQKVEAAATAARKSAKASSAAVGDAATTLG